MARELSRSTYSGLGAVGFLLAIAAVGLASVAVQIGGVGWILGFVALVLLAVVLFWGSVQLLRRGRLHVPPAGSEHQHS